MTARRWIVAALSGLSTTGLGVFINLATELKSSTWAWAAVGLLTVMGVLFGVGSERLLAARQSAAKEPPTSVVNRGTLVTIGGEKNRVKINILGAGAMVALSFIVIVAVVTGILTGRATQEGSPSGTAPSKTTTTVNTPTPSAYENALVINLDRLRAFSEGWYAVFPRGAERNAEQFSKTDPLPSDEIGMDDFFRRELADGAYIALAAGLPMRLVLNLRNTTTKDLIIRNLVVKNKQDGPVLDGTAIFVEAGGGAEPTALLHLDAAYPVARILDQESGEDAGAYFAARPITVHAGTTATLPINMDARTASHVFTLSIEYEIDGRRFSQIVDNNGQPFRVTPAICASEPSTAGLTYQAVHQMTYEPPDYRPRLKPEDPVSNSARC